MMNYNPTVNDVSGQILGQGLERQGAYNAAAIQAQAEADLAKAMRQHSNIVKGVGVVGDVVKLAASIYTGGAAGAAMSMAGGMGGGGGGGGGGGDGGAIGSIISSFANKKAMDAKDSAYTSFFSKHGKDLGFDPSYLDELKTMSRDDRLATFDVMTGASGQRLGSLEYLNQQSNAFGGRGGATGGAGGGQGAFYTVQ
jgi:hypothetical protein